MSRFLLVLPLLLVLVSAPAGTITGNVRAQGKPGAEPEGSGGKYDSRQFKFVERVDYDAMRDFIVYIEGPIAGKAPEKPAQIVTARPSVAQHKAMFEPHVLPILKGTTVEWPNNDDILHNVFSCSEPARFDLGLYKRPYTNQIPSVTFTNAGRVDVFCSIHTRMSCIVMVLENPWFASTGDKGNYSITNVPAGTYQLKAWHERLPIRSREVTVTDNGVVKVDFVLSPGSGL